MQNVSCTAVSSPTAPYARFDTTRAFCPDPQTEPSSIEIDQEIDREPVLNFKAVVAYDGTDFSGFQLQVGQSQSQTVQGRLEKAMTTVTLQPRQVLLTPSSLRS